MHVVILLHNLVKKSCVGIHSKRLGALFVLVMGLTLGGKLSVAGIGRSLKGEAKTKNKIKQVDRLVGNVKLHAERGKFYVLAGKMVISNSKKPPIIVDWSCKVCAKANREPWLLATSLNSRKKIAKKVTQLYKKRFQIEEGFRDIKNSRLGFSFEESLTYKPERFEILLLIAMLAILAVTILGKAGELRQLQYAFQANTIRTRTVLSLFFLGCQIIRDENIKFSEEELLEALNALISSINVQKDINA